MSDFLDVKRNEINQRLKELQPLVAEYQQLEAAAAALKSVDGGTRSSSTRAARGRPAKRTSSTSRRRPGRRRGSGTRGAQALSLVQGQPGITIPELASKMGIKQNYLYRVLPGLEQDGSVYKDGRGWHPKKPAA
jgi:hypothetical protein